nr:MFS transporter [Roseovarius sp. MMSF_3305]
MELTLVPLLLPTIQMQFGLSIGELTWVFNSYGSAVAIGVLLGGWFGDTFDTRRVFSVGVTFFVAGSLIVVSADNFQMLIVGRTLQGFGSGIFSPLVPVLLTRAAPLTPGKMLIFWGSIAGYIAALAPLFYGNFLSEHGWSIAFILIAAIAIVALFFSKDILVTKNDVPHAQQKPNYIELFRSRDLWLMFVYVFCTYGSISYFLFRLPIVLSENEIKTSSIGFALSVLWLTFSGLSTLLRNKVDAPHVRTIMLIGPLFIVVGFLLSYVNENMLFLLLSSVFVGAGLACSNAPSTQLVLKFAPKGMSAISTSLDITFARLGGIATVAMLARVEFEYTASAICLLCFLATFCALAASKVIDECT